MHKVTLINYYNIPIADNLYWEDYFIGVYICPIKMNKQNSYFMSILNTEQ